MKNVLSHELRCAFKRYVATIAIVNPDGKQISYHVLNEKVAYYRSEFQKMGIGRGMVVGICSQKSADVIAVMLALGELNAVYVPLDVESPGDRLLSFVRESGIKVLLTIPSHGDLATQAFGGVLSSLGPFTLMILKQEGKRFDGCRYLLFTSGTTGRAKAVLFDESNILCFVHWGSRLFELKASDTIGSIAPFHFDLSILDIYGSLLTGATLRLYDRSQVKNPRWMANAIKGDEISVLYSTPSFFTLLTRFGKLDNDQLMGLRLILYAGEVYSLDALRQLRTNAPRAALYNLYGPTETNVVSYKYIPTHIPADQTVPYSIGQVCDYAQFGMLKVDKVSRFASGDEGELLITGRSVCRGYIQSNLDVSDDFITLEGIRWYRSGDYVRMGPDGDYHFIGRKDRLVKRSGHRIELKEIELSLLRNPLINQTAVLTGQWKGQIAIFAVLSYSDKSAYDLVQVRESLLAYLPIYMLPDRFILRDSIPMTSNLKIDYQSLQLEYFD